MITDIIHNLSLWWQDQLAWQREPGLWVLGSMAVGVLASWTLWLVLRWNQHRVGVLSERLDSPWNRLISWLLRLAWLIGPGYASLLLGLSSPRLMGLTQIDWGPGLGYGLGFGLLAGVLLLVAGLSYRRAGTNVAPWPSMAAALTGSARLVIEAGALQWHWAFYRSVLVAAASALGAQPPESWGTWGAVVLISLEGALSPLLWRDLAQPGLAERRILRLMLLVASSGLYLISRNFWLSWSLHAVTIAVLEPRFTAHR